jgi:TPR repeat protein
MSIAAMMMRVLVAASIGLASSHAPAADTPSGVKEAVARYEAGDIAAARKNFESLAARGVPIAHHNLAMMLLRGETPAAGDDERTRRALAHLNTAARGGFVTAQLTLGQLHDDGRLVPRDRRRALAWYERAARAGSVDAQIAAGSAYYVGQGHARDAKRALHWYRRAAASGDIGAQYLVAAMYEHGDGVAVDARAAAHWYRAAAAQGDIAAAAKLEALDRRP